VAVRCGRLLTRRTRHEFAGDQTLCLEVDKFSQGLVVCAGYDLCGTSLDADTAVDTRRRNKVDRALSNKTVHNIYMFLSSFYNWAGRELSRSNPLKGVPAPKFEQVPVEPFTKEENTALLKACEVCHEARTTLRRSYTMQRVNNVHRDQALILVLLDRGLYARRALWHYLVDRADGKEFSAPLFTDRYDHPLNKNSLRLAIARLGKKAGVKHCHPHRWWSCASPSSLLDLNFQNKKTITALCVVMVSPVAFCIRSTGESLSS
jgi:integrase